MQSMCICFSMRTRLQFQCTAPKLPTLHTGFCSLKLREACRPKERQIASCLEKWRVGGGLVGNQIQMNHCGGRSVVESPAWEAMSLHKQRADRYTRTHSYIYLYVYAHMSGNYEHSTMGNSKYIHK